MIAYVKKWESYLRGGEVEWMHDVIQLKTPCEIGEIIEDGWLVITPMRAPFETEIPCKFEAGQWVSCVHLWGVSIFTSDLKYNRADIKLIDEETILFNNEKKLVYHYAVRR